MRFHPHARAASVRAPLLLVVLLASVAVDARPIAGQTFAVAADGNEIVCYVRSSGQVCDPQFDGGVWPAGSRNQYVFDAGLVVAGIVGAGAPAAWQSDTVPAYFFDHRGTRYNGSAISGIYSSARSSDLDVWPRVGGIEDFPFATASISDESLFSVIHLGQQVASDLDTWTLMWEGNPALLSGRPHPLGIAVEQRTMQWNDPYGAESILFVVYRITNVTNLPAFRDTVAQTFFGGDLSAVPANGWMLDSVFVGFAMDSDVTFDSQDNLALLIPSFGVAGAYHAYFEAPSQFDFRPELFHPPFFGNAPGMVASALVHADASGGEDAETRIVSEYADAGCADCNELWFQLSGHDGTAEGMPPCTFPDPIASGMCHLSQVPDGVETYQSVGPWNLAPGEAATVVYAIVAAATVETPAIIRGAENPPGIPAAAPGCDGAEILPIERAAGWVSTPVCPAAGERADPDLVETVPGSLLHRIQIARSMVATGFLEPFAPEAPAFHVMPADSGVHVVWEPSITEQPMLGDPYHDAASDTTSALYNPNYRDQDVEGYRVYRSTDRVNWQLIAQYDYSDTEFVDVLCETDRTHVAGAPCSGMPETIPIADRSFLNDSEFVQYRPGDILESASGQPIVVFADSASAGFPALSDNAPEFVHTDSDVRAGFRYFYQVRAFDVNSYRSGPSSLESASATKSIVVQSAFANRTDGSLETWLEGADGVRLDPNSPLPEIDAETGVFSGPMPPTNALQALLRPAVDDLLPDFRVEFRIDSVRIGPAPGVPCAAGADQLGACWRLFYTVSRDGADSLAWTDGFTPVWDAFGGPGLVSWQLLDLPIPMDSAALAAVHAPGGFGSLTAFVRAQLDESIFNSASEGQLNRRAGGSSIPADVIAGGSRWFDGAEETVADPARLTGVGRLAGIDSVWAPIHHTNVGDGSTYPASTSMQCYSYVVSGIARAADLRVTWQDGTITVEDVTHHVPVPFKPTVQQSWGFVQDGNGNGHIDWQDFDYAAGIGQALAANPFCTEVPPGSEQPLMSEPVVGPVSTEGLETGTSATGTGFGLYINAQRFIFETNGGVPADGTTWTLRTYHGYVEASDGANTLDPSGYSYSSFGPGGVTEVRPPFVPGLRVVFEGSAAGFEGAPDLARVHTVPDPFYYHSVFGATAQDRGRVIRFVNLPPSATIRIYTLTGILVDVVHHDDAASGIAVWDARTRDGNTAAPGVYFYHVSAPDAEEHVGRFTIVTSGRYVE